MIENKKNKFIPYGKQNITEEDITAVKEVLLSPFLTQGPIVPKFENKISKIVNCKYSIAVNSATSALHIACLSLDLGPGDILWTSSTTFVSSANCGKYCGADIDFVDIDPLTGLMSVNNLREKLKHAKKIGKLPKIVIPVHLAGASCDMKSIWSLSQEYSFSIIEDASHAIGGKYENNFVGNCKFSSVCIFSFHPVKIITTGEGGMAVTNNFALAKKMRMLRSHGITKEKSEFFMLSPGEWNYEQQYLGFNYRLSDIHAALGISQLKKLNENVKRRNRILNMYKRELKEVPLNFLEIPKNTYSAVHLAVVKLKNKKSDYHQKVFNDLRKANIGIQLHYLPVHLQPFYRKLGFKEGDFPNSEEYAKNAFSLPIFPNLKDEEIKYVIRKLKELVT